MTTTIKRPTVGKEVRDYIMIFIAMMSYCIGWTVFLLPNNITTGGVPGISSVIYWGTGVPVQVSYFVINALLMIAALRVLGLKFCIKTIYGIVVLTTAISIMQEYTAGMQLLKDQPFMAAVIGACFCGCRIVLTFPTRTISPIPSPRERQTAASPPPAADFARWRWPWII